MVKVKYIPQPGTSDETETLGHKFNAHKATDVTDPTVLQTLRGNPFFKVMDKKDDDDDKAETVKEKAEAKKAEAEKTDVVSDPAAAKGVASPTPDVSEEKPADAAEQK